MSVDPAEGEHQDAEVVPFATPSRRTSRWRRDPARFAASQRQVFSGMNLHVGKSHIVHSVAWIDWIDDLVLPAPECRQGFAGHGAHGELRATTWPVTCQRCQRLHQQLRGDTLFDVPSEDTGRQIGLF